MRWMVEATCIRAASCSTAWGPAKQLTPAWVAAYEERVRACGAPPPGEPGEIEEEWQAMVTADPMAIAELPQEATFKARLQRSGHLEDGWLDLVVTNYIDWNPKNNIWCGEQRPGYRSYCHPGNYKGQRIKLYHYN